MRRVTVAERRARLGRRQHLAAKHRLADVVRLAADLGGLHATDPATVYLAAAARLRRPTVAAIERALYERRTLLRMLAMRRTMFTVPTDLVGEYQAASADAVAARERARLLGVLADSGVAEPERWLPQVEKDTLAALAARGGARPADLAADVPELARTLVLGKGTRWEITQTAATRVVMVLAAAGHVGRGRPLGSWTSSSHAWEPLTNWLPDGVPARPVAEARTALVRRWLAAFGPGTVADLRWWTGWSAGEVKAALAGVATVEVELEGAGAGLVLAGDEDRVPAPEPWAALLPALDPTVMGWKGRDWYLGDHGPSLFDRSGNAGPTVWWDGRVVGGWAQRKDGTVAVRVLDDVGADASAAVEAGAEGLERWLGAARVTPRFRTPLERQLAG